MTGNYCHVILLAVISILFCEKNMDNDKIRKIKNYVIIAVCVISVAVSAINYLKPHEKQSASEYIVFYNNEQANAQTSTDNNESVNQEGKISINKATKEELLSLPGIGETKANAIIEYRNAYGGFVSIDEITEVKGIGEATLAKFRDKITL